MAYYTLHARLAAQTHCLHFADCNFVVRSTLSKEVGGFCSSTKHRGIGFFCKAGPWLA
jgi:hypothetical protein